MLRHERTQCREDRIGADGQIDTYFIVPIMQFRSALLTPATNASTSQTAANGKLYGLGKVAALLK